MKSFIAALALAASCVAAVPNQLHLAPYPGGMTVSWQTKLPTVTSTVQFGTTPSGLSSNSSGWSETYGFTWSHHAILKDLQPSTTYFYTAGDAQDGFTAVNNFTTAPKTGEHVPFSFAVVGDMGAWESNATRAWLDTRLKAQGFDMLWHVGDIAYADDAFLHDFFGFGYEHTWNEYMEWMSDVTSTVPYMVLPGNHEAECHSPACQFNETLKDRLHNFTAYNTRFHMPWGPSGTPSSMWYSYDYGRVHFVNLNSETNYANAPLDEHAFVPNGNFSGDQLAWARSDLAAAAARKAAGEIDWIFAGMHRPIYSITHQEEGTVSGSAAYLSGMFGTLLEEFGVDVFFAGHEHAYECSFPVAKNGSVFSTDYNDPQHPVYIVSGAGGNSEGLSSFDSVKFTPQWSAAALNQFTGFGEMTVVNATTLHWTYWNAYNGTVGHEFWLNRA